ncbi:MAG: hypothetical protein LBV61_04500 [Burkholderiaceae bacterium]|jgi:hypothetical protein|nr:hypothetical protein [Burkholderiaceae bacterium]
MNDAQGFFGGISCDDAAWRLFTRMSLKRAVFSVPSFFSALPAAPFNRWGNLRLPAPKQSVADRWSEV